MAESLKRFKTLMLGPGFTAAVACEHFRDLRAYISRRVGNPHDSDDVTQEVWLRVVWYECRIKEPVIVVQPLGLLCRIADWVIADFCDGRAKGRALWESSNDIEYLEMVADEDAAASDPGEDWDRHRQVKEVLSELTPALAATLILVHRDGWSYKEAARILGISVSGVDKNLQRALALLRNGLFPDTGG